MKPSHSAFSCFCMFLFFSVFNQRFWFVTVDFALEKDSFLTVDFTHSHPEATAPSFQTSQRGWGSTAISTQHYFPKKTVLPNPKAPSYTSPAFARLRCSLAAAARPCLPRYASPIFLFSLLPQTHVQPSLCSLKCGR